MSPTVIAAHCPASTAEQVEVIYLVPIGAIGLVVIKLRSGVLLLNEGFRTIVPLLRARRSMTDPAMMKWIAVGVVVLLGIGLAAFEPWRAFTHSTIDESLPVSGPSSTSAGAPESSEGLEGYSTSDCPDLFVGPSDAPSGGACGFYDDDRYRGSALSGPPTATRTT